MGLSTVLERTLAGYLDESTTAAGHHKILRQYNFAAWTGSVSYTIWT